METQQIKFAICIPTLNRADLLIPSLMRYSMNFPNAMIIVYDNGMQNICGKMAMIKTAVPEVNTKNIVCYGGENKNIGVAGAWNFMLQKAYEVADWAWVLNDDVYIQHSEATIQSILSRLEVSKSMADLYLAGQHYQRETRLRTNYEWSSFLLPKATFDSIGKFDERFFPAYFEDNDYMYRIDVVDRKIDHLPMLIPQVVLVSQTLERDPSLKSQIHKCEQYYIQKWGGLPNNEKFLKPQN